MLRKSLTTFQAGEKMPLATSATPASSALPEGPLSRLTPDECRRCLRLLELFADPADSGARLLEAALVVDGAGKREAALLLYRLSLVTAPTPTAFNNIAVLYAEDDAPDAEDRALEWLERGLEQFPHDLTLLENYALFREE